MKNTNPPGGSFFLLDSAGKLCYNNPSLKETS